MIEKYLPPVTDNKLNCYYINVVAGRGGPKFLYTQLGSLFMSVTQPRGRAPSKGS